MPMTLNTEKFSNFAAKRTVYADAVKEGVDSDKQASAFAEMMDALSSDSIAEITNQVQEKADEMFSARTVDPKITNEEVKFFNELASGDFTHKESEEVTLPETTIDQIFQDLTTDHPFLQAIHLQTTGLRLKFLKSDAKGVAVWGKVFDGIKGQLTASFSDEKADQSKLTAFVAIPNDVLEFGAPWIKTFVTTQITEAFAVAAELAFVTGDGNSQPIGLNRQVQKDVTVTGGVYPEKESVGTITLADNATAKRELGAIVKALSKKENGKAYAARGKVTLLVSPGISVDMETAMTMQNVNGQWVLAYPFGINVVESEAVPDGKLIAFVADRYDAYCAGGINIKTFDQTLALEDGTLYTAKQFFYGKAEDNNSAFVYDLNLSASGTKTDAPTA